MASHGFSIANLSYRLHGETFEYQMVLRTAHAENLPRLAQALSATPQVLEFRLSPTGD